MVTKTRLPRRRSIRLANYDYSQPGDYFITLCVNHHLSLFGTIDQGIMHLNNAGEMIDTYWLAIPERFPSITLDDYVVMPNHFHGILCLEYYEIDTKPVTIGECIGAFKSLTQLAYDEGVRNQAWQSISSPLWQRNYYEHIIRSERTLELTRDYITTNPQRIRHYH